MWRLRLDAFGGACGGGAGEGDAPAWELVDEGLLTEADFRDFTFANAATMWKEANPDFFQGTVVADAVRAL